MDDAFKAPLSGAGVCSAFLSRSSFPFSNAALTCRDGRVPPLGERNASGHCWTKR